MSCHKILTTILCLTSCCKLYSTPASVSTPAQLDAAIEIGNSPITFTSSINISAGLPRPSLFPVNSNGNFIANSNTTLIDGAGNTLSGGSVQHGFFVRGGTITIQNITFSQLTANGGAGGTGGSGGGGGGGMGAGGAVYAIGGSSVTLNNCTFSSCSAVGGLGGAASGAVGSITGGGGGGGLYGAGGGASTEGGGGGGGFIYAGGFDAAAGGGGGGGGGIGSAGTQFGGTGGFGGNNAVPEGGGAGGAANNVGPGGNGADGPFGGTGGGGGGWSQADQGGSGGMGNLAGGGGGGGGNASVANITNLIGGAGGSYGGGGGGGLSQGPTGMNGGGSAGAGGFGAGGGGGAMGIGSDAGAEGLGGTGGAGGFGAGGGGGGDGQTTGGTTSPGAGGAAGFGGQAGGAGGVYPAAAGAGGNGASFGGAIFMETGSTVTLAGTTSFSGNTATARTGASGLGSDIFMMVGSQLNVNVTGTLTLPNPIQSQGGAFTPGGVNVMGGTLDYATNNLANTFVGTNTISQNGTLLITNDFNLGPVTNPLLFDSTSGSPTLATTSAGTVNLNPARSLTFTGSGTSTYQVNSGTLTDAHALALGTGSFAVNTATAATASLTGVISGVNVTKLGAGTLNFNQTSPNTYTGLTTVSDGLMNLNNSGGVAIPGNVLISGGTLSQLLVNQIAPTSAMTLSGGTFNMGAFPTTLSSLTFDSGTLTQGGAILTLTSGSNALTMQNGTTVAGPVTLSASGSINLSGPGSATISGNVNNTGGSPVTWDIASASSSMDFSGAFSGAGGLTKTGLGLLNLSGASTYSGPTTVSQGILAVNGSIASSTTVNTGATLRGTGTITGNVNVFGTISPGNSIGTLTVNGNYIQESGSTYFNEITPTTTDLLIVNGTATINPGATFELSPEMTFYNPYTTFVVIHTSGGVTGTFSNFMSTFPFTGILEYTPNEVLLEVDIIPYASVVPPKTNCSHVAKALDKIFNGGDPLDPIFMRLLAVPFGDLCDAFNQMQPALYTGAGIVQQSNAIAVNNALGHRFQYVLDDIHCPSLKKCPKRVEKKQQTPEQAAHLQAELSALIEEKNQLQKQYIRSYDTAAVLQETAAACGSKKSRAQTCLDINSQRIQETLKALANTNGLDKDELNIKLASLQQQRQQLQSLHDNIDVKTAELQQNVAIITAEKTENQRKLDEITSKIDRVQNTLANVDLAEQMAPTDQYVPCRPKDKLVHVWASGIGDFLNQKDNHFARSPQIGYNSSTGGTVGGLDFHILKYLYVGALGAYTHSNISWNHHHQAQGEINSSYASLYASAIGRIFYVNTSVMGSWNHYSAHRKIIFPGTNETARNRHNGAQVLSHIDTGLNFGFGGCTLRPFDSFDYITQTEHKYRERGAGAFNLTVLEKKLNMYRNELGLNFARCFNFNPSNKITLDAKLSWVYEKRIKGKATTSRFQDTRPTFTVNGYYTNRSFISPGLTLSYIQDVLDLTAYYDAQFGTKYRNQTVGLQAGLSF